jgi:PAS domain S-box-containing protein
MLFLACLLLPILAWPQDEPRQPVVLQLQWKHQFEFAGFYAAIHRGFYAQRGLEVEVREYQQGMDIVEEVLSGRAHYGLLHSGIVQARLEGKPVKLLANYFKRNPMVILARPPIATLADLRGKRLMVADKDTSAPLFRLAFQQEGLTPGEDVLFVPHTHDAVPFERGEVEAMTAFATNEPFYLERNGIPFNVIELADYLPSLGEEYLFTSEAQAEQHRELTQAFIEASNEGWRHALDHPEEIVDLILSDYSQRKGREALLYEAAKTARMVRPLPLPIGEVFPSLIDEVAALIRRQQGIEDQGRLRGFLFEADRPEPAKLALNGEERAWLASHPRIVLGMSDQFPPALIREEDGRLGGIVVDYLDLINLRLGSDIRLAVESAWSEVGAKAIAGETDGIATAADTPAWTGHLLLSKPYLESDTYLFIRSDGVLPGTSPAALAGRRVGFLQGTKRIEALLRDHPEILATPLEGNQAVADALIDGRVELVIGDASLEYWRRLRAQPLFRVGGLLDHGQVKLHFAVRKDWSPLVALLDKALADIPAEEHLRIRERWLGFGETAHRPQAGLSLTPEERAWLQAHPRVRYCFSADRPPYDFTENGQPQGWFADYLALLGQRSGIQFIAVPAAGCPRAQEMAKRRECDLLAGTPRPREGPDHLAFTRPYMKIPQVFLAKADKPFEADLGAFAGQRIGVIRGALRAHDYPRLFPAIDWVAGNPEEIFALLERDEIHAALVGLEMATGHVDQSAGRYRIIGKTDQPLEISVAVRDDWPELVSLLDKAMASLSEADHNEIRRKWTRYTLEERVDYTLLGWVGGGLLVLLALVLAWNRGLARSREAVRRSESFIRTTLDALSEHLCVLDGEGRIVIVNRAWRAFGAANPPIPKNYGIGANYLAVCERAVGADAAHAARFAEGLRAVMRGERTEFHLEYPCDSADQGRWFIAHVTPFPEDSELGRVLVTHEDVTQRKQAEIAKEAARARMEEALATRNTILDNALVAIALLRERRLVWVNDHALAMFGYPREELLGRSVEILYADPADFRKVGEDAPPVLLRGDSYQGEYRYRRKDGSAFWCQISGKLVDPASPAKGAIYIVNDIDQRRRAEERLQAGEARLRAIIDAEPECIKILDREGNLLEMNPAGLAMVEADALEQVAGRPVLDLIAPEYHEAFLSLHQRVMAGETQTLEYEVIGLRGGRRWLETHAVPLDDEAGRVQLAVTRDITERKRAAEQLRKLSRAVEQSHSTIVITDLDARIEFANPAFSHITGYTLAEALGQNPRILQSGEHDADFYRAMWATLRRGEVWQGELHNKRKDGGLYWEFATISPVKDERGVTTHYVAVKEDITVQRRQQDELKRAKQAAEAANRAKSAFLANMSHELRTPLNAMLGHAQILQRDAGLSDKQRRGVETIQRSGDHLITLINDILDLAKIEAGRIDLTPAPCDPHALFRGLEELFRLRAQEKGIGFRYLERTPLPALVEADEKRLRQIAMNLLGNAVKFTEQGEVVLEAGYGEKEMPSLPEMASLPTEGWLTLAVIDSGIGIPADRIAALFQPFQQEGTEEYRNQGTGLGLAIVKQLVEQMGGTIEVQSEPGQGSRFSLRLPLPALAAPPPGRGAQSAGPPVAYRRRDGGADPLRILVVDDMADNREVLRGLLEPLGFAVNEATDGLGALAAAARQPPDLVLMDLVMPGMDGLEATRRLRGTPEMAKPPVVIACSASAYPEDRQRSRAAGCVDHLAKPVRGAELCAVLEAHLPLAWETAPVETQVLETDPAPITPERREVMLDLVRRGQIRPLREYLEALPAVPAELREAVAGFDLKRVRALLEKT